MSKYVRLTNIQNPNIHRRPSWDGTHLQVEVHDLLFVASLDKAWGITRKHIGCVGKQRISRSHMSACPYLRKLSDNLWSFDYLRAPWNKEALSERNNAKIKLCLFHINHHKRVWCLRKWGCGGRDGVCNVTRVSSSRVLALEWCVFCYPTPDKETVCKC